ncbi:hypothetical protein VitviT2T_014908 [Vitis vinifera]|uniref:BHLH domain-containing protein n=1 Tax=Vitis vinifera TaxID=29760 RepID=A0ABY9CL41_VITVI|nr:transcription factor DYT1 [Vitis vinifera]WJZ96199.1 hypothetical protein VitviT2T_014908 [Vitis vinifera]|eukprot:XP_003635187.1 PREDICTED: transcription factor DYT1-like [Vitis vinifera]
MEYADCAPDGSCVSEGAGSGKGRMRMRGQEREYKSKNLQAERRRRQKLSDRLLALRALVPIITNMNKATIIEDAITYIKELQKNVKDLSDQLLEMEASSEEEAKQRSETIDAAEEMNKCGIEEDVEVTNIDGNKFWLKIVIQKKRSSFTKLVEAMNFLGFEFTDTSVTTSKGAILITACVEGIYGETFAAAETRELLQEIIKGI